MLKIIICLFLIGNYAVFPQNLFPDRDEKLQQLKTRKDIKVTEIEKGIYKLQFSDGYSIIKNTNDCKSAKKNKIKLSATYDSTIIDLRTIDTTLFYQKYSFWQGVNAGSQYTAPPLLGDVNNNNLPEIYAFKKDYTTDYSNIVIMEENFNGIFDSVYSYDSTTTPRAIYDINKDGLYEVPFRRYPFDSLYPGHSWPFYTPPDENSFATDLSFIFYPFPGTNNQLNNNTFGDWDGDDFTDQVFIRDCCPMSFNIYEYNFSVNNFDSIYCYDLSNYGLFFDGFAIGDFDQDGRTEFLAGGVNGEFVSFENCGNNCYQFIYNGYLETYNAYLHTVTNDLDGNGKQEIWIGGDYYLNGVGYTRLIILEANADNNYSVVGKVDLIGVFSWDAFNMQSQDVDKDGKEEVMICIDEHILILKFNGYLNHQTYSTFYLKRNELALMGMYSDYYGAIMKDVTGDGKEDIIIHMSDIIPNLGIKLFTFIYKSNLLSEVNEYKNSTYKFILYQNFPNPFNPATRIRYDIPEKSEVTIKVFNILGKEITTLLDKELSPGSFTIDWAAKDVNGNLLPSGVYLIRLDAVNARNDYENTIKTVLVK